MTKMIHSYWAYLVLILLIISIVRAIQGLISKRQFSTSDLRISLFTMIVSHIQFVIGIVAFYMSWQYKILREDGMGEIMGVAHLRKTLIEHPVMILIALVLLTIGFSRIKRKETDRGKFKSILIYYALALLLILMAIPWGVWFGA